jgi:hypothetical protein
MIDENLPSKLALRVVLPLHLFPTTSLPFPSILEAPLRTPIANTLSSSSVLPQEQLTKHQPEYNLPSSKWKRAGAGV